MNQLDEYILSVLARMEVDDAERLEIERELCAHLEEAIGEGTQKGLSRVMAEQEAMVSFGQPSLLARQFSARGGRKWLYFERFCLAVLWWFVYGLFIPGFLENTLVDYLILGAGWLFILKSAYERVDVNGGILFRRLGRSSISIPFSGIESVKFEKFHLFGRRRLVIQYSGGGVTLRSTMPGMRAAAVSLKALCRPAMDGKVLDFIGNLPLRVRREKALFRVALSILWFALGVCIAWNFHWTWQGLPRGSGIVIGGLVPFFLWPLQGWFHADRSKSGICWILLPVSVFPPAAFVMGLINGNVNVIRWGMALLLLAPMLGLLLLWWRGSRKALVCIGLCIVVLLWFSVQLSITIGERTEEGISTGIGPESSIMEMSWTKDGLYTATGYAEIEEDPDQRWQLMLYYGLPFKEHHKILLGKDNWSFLPDRPGGEKYFAFWEYTDQFFTDLYRVDFQEGCLIKDDSYPNLTNIWVLALKGSNLWSPDGTKIAGDYSLKIPGETQEANAIHSSPKRDYALMVYDLTTGVTTTLKMKHSVEYLAWEDNNTIHVIDVDYADADPITRKRTGPTQIEVYRVHLEEQKSKVISEYSLKADDMINILPGSQYALIDYSDFDDGDDERTGGENKQSILLNLLSGQETMIIPHGQGALTERYSWLQDRRRLAIVVNPYRSRESHLVIIEATKGVVAERDIGTDERLSHLRLSPDGNQLLYIRSRYFGLGPFQFPMGRLEVWDISSDKIIPIGLLGIPSTILGTMFDNTNTLPRWSPDGKVVVYNHIGYGGEQKMRLEFVALQDQ